MMINNVEPVHIFLSGSRSSDRSHSVKIIYNDISKTLLYHCKHPEKPRFLLLGPSGISEVNMGGTTIHFGLAISTSNRMALSTFNDKFDEWLLRGVINSRYLKMSSGIFSSSSESKALKDRMFSKVG